ncbi:acyl-CoA dehydrogenase [candidate division BRC1 bacterium SM23_51]|nr:MAG: acyl-CoA dehydrogenase [candidate division BRC1 bacterium SM23_51]
MDYGLTEEQQMIRDLARKVAEEKILPVRAELDETEEFPEEPLRALAEAELFGIYIPEEYGGFGGGALDQCIAVEELSRICGGVAVSFAASALAAYPILLFGTDEQKQKYLPDLAAGRKYAAFALTEPNAGSDVSAIETTARKDGDSYILNGSKQWITNGGVASVYTVITTVNKARGARGLTAFVVERDTPGLTVGKKEKKMGIRCSDTRELHFEDCRVPAENLLVKEGRGFRVAMTTFDKSRPGIGAQAVGIAQGAFEEAVKFAKTREQFGQKISGFQAIQFMLADMATQIEAARLLVYQAAREVDANSPAASKSSAMAKVYASDVAMRVTTDALQVCGGSGYMREYPLEKMMRDAKITQIYEGTNQIMRSIIGLAVIRESAQWK